MAWYDVQIPAWIRPAVVTPTEGGNDFAQGVSLGQAQQRIGLQRDELGLQREAQALQARRLEMAEATERIERNYKLAQTDLLKIQMKEREEFPQTVTGFTADWKAASGNTDRMMETYGRWIAPLSRTDTGRAMLLNAEKQIDDQRQRESNSFAARLKFQQEKDTLAEIESFQTQVRQLTDESQRAAVRVLAGPDGLPTSEAWGQLRAAQRVQLSQAGLVPSGANLTEKGLEMQFRPPEAPGVTQPGNAVLLNRLSEAEADLAAANATNDPEKISPAQARVNNLRAQAGQSALPIAPLPPGRLTLSTGTRTFLEQRLAATEPIMDDLKYLRAAAGFTTVGPIAKGLKGAKETMGIGDVMEIFGVGTKAVQFQTRLKLAELNAARALINEGGQISQSEREMVREAFTPGTWLASPAGARNRMDAIARSVSQKALDAARQLGRPPPPAVLAEIARLGDLSVLSPTELQALADAKLIDEQQMKGELDRRDRLKRKP